MFIYYSFPIIYAYIREYNDYERLNNFFQGDNIGLFLTLLGCYRCNANGCSQNTSPFLHHKENAPCYGNSRKKRVSLAAIAKYIMIISFIGYLQIFKTGYFFTKVLPLRLTKPQITILFYLARLVSVTQKQELQTSEVSSEAINHSLNKTLFVFDFFIFSCGMLLVIIHKPDKKTGMLTRLSDNALKLEYHAGLKN